jgi:hypothetical protein
MKVMFFLIPVVSLFFACTKETQVETELLPGKWNLVKTELFEHDSLKATAHHSEINTSYLFDPMEEGNPSSGLLFIEEDGEQASYDYVHHASEKSIVLDNQTVFTIELITDGQLKLSRSYDDFRSEYVFLKEN